MDFPGDAPGPDGPEGGIYTARDLMRAKFHALGGGRIFADEIKKLPKLDELVTDAHRDMVLDLARSGLSQKAVALSMGVSKTRLRELFLPELKTAYPVAHANMTNVLFVNGLAGDSNSALAWVRNHNRTKWGTISKVEKTEKGAEQATAEVAATKQAGIDLVNMLLTGMSTDKNLFKRPAKGQQEPTKVVESVKTKPVKPGVTRTKVKGD